MDIKTIRSRKLRTNMTFAEKTLWSQLRLKNIKGLKFRRQHPIGPYYVDFVCIKNKFVIELDGSQHLQNISYDEYRTAYLGLKGYRVIRFWDNEVLLNPKDVLSKIYNEV